MKIKCAGCGKRITKEQQETSAHWNHEPDCFYHTNLEYWKKYGCECDLWYHEFCCPCQPQMKVHQFI
jgi:hypothetical protein